MSLALRGRVNVALALLVMVVFALACKFGDETADANKLVDKASEEIKMAKALQDKNEQKTADYRDALNNGKFDDARKILNDVNKDIDEGVKHGEAAANSLEEASKKKIDEKFKEYLTLRAQSVRKRIDSYKELKNMFSATQDMLANPTAAGVQSAQPKIKASQEKISQLDKEADELEEKSDKVRKENPDKFAK